jgi:hypothetical protein
MNPVETGNGLKLNVSNSDRGMSVGYGGATATLPVCLIMAVR